MNLQSFLPKNNHFNFFPPQTAREGFWLIGKSYNGGSKHFIYNCVGHSFWSNHITFQQLRWKRFTPRNKNFHWNISKLEEINDLSEAFVCLSCYEVNDPDHDKFYTLDDLNHLLSLREKNHNLIVMPEVKSIIDRSYIGTPDDYLRLQDLGITQIQNSENDKDNTADIGWNAKKQKWFGWSHRAMFGFGIGSSVKKGDCAYQPIDKDDFLQDMISFWTDKESVATGRFGENSYEDGKTESGVWITTKTTELFNSFPDQFGKGEWTAKTLEDAKQMASDFAHGVS